MPYISVWREYDFSSPHSVIAFFMHYCSMKSRITIEKEKLRKEWLPGAGFYGKPPYCPIMPPSEIQEDGEINLIKE